MFEINNSLCTECRICMSICSWAHFGEYNAKRSRIVVDAVWPKPPAVNVCLACKGHECVEACPEDALTWNKWIILDRERCTSCMACVSACPVNGVAMDPHTNLPLICDTCEGDFQCTAWCPTKAIERRRGE